MKWPSKPLGELVDFFSGNAWKAARFTDGPSGMPIIRIQNIDAVRKSGFVYWPDDYDRRFLISPGDILLSLSGSFRVEVWAGPKALLNQRIVKLTPREGVDRTWLLHAVQNVVGKIEAMGRHALVNNVALSDLRNLPLALPPLDEQKRIAAILDQADELRRKRQRAIERLNQLGQAIFYEMFGRPVHEESNYKELSIFLSFVTSGGRGWSKYYTDRGTRFIRSLDVQMNYISFDDAAYVDAPGNAEARRTSVLAGDVLLTITGSKIGRAAPVPTDFGPAFVSQHVAILRMDRTKLDPTFLSYFLSLEDGGQKQISQNQYGQTKPGLNFEQIGRFRLPEVPLERQKEFTARIAAIGLLQTNALRASDANKQLFSSIQNRAFRGEL